MIRNLIFGALIGSFLIACEAKSNAYPPPRLTPDEVLVAVTAYLEERETQLDNYEISLVGFNYTNRSWGVGYDGISLTIGDHFWVKVSDDDISEISLVPGL